MNKLVLFLGAAILCMGVSAQEPRWSVSILPGYQFNTDSYTYAENSYWNLEGSIKSNFVGSVDLGLGLTDRFGLHFGYLVNNGNYAERYYSEHYVEDWTYYKAPIAIWEIGPEWHIRLSPKTHLYAQVNLGRTVSSGQATYIHPYYGDFRETVVRPNGWAYGAAAGFRLFFIPNAGIAGQVAYHRVSGWRISGLWDVRLGATFRF